jgi:hypothetical protein
MPPVIADNAMNEEGPVWLEQVCTLMAVHSAIWDASRRRLKWLTKSKQKGQLDCLKLVDGNDCGAV